MVWGEGNDYSSLAGWLCVTVLPGCTQQHHGCLTRAAEAISILIPVVLGKRLHSSPLWSLLAAYNMQVLPQLKGTKK